MIYSILLMFKFQWTTNNLICMKQVQAAHQVQVAHQAQAAHQAVSKNINYKFDNKNLVLILFINILCCTQNTLIILKKYY